MIKLAFKRGINVKFDLRSDAFQRLSATMKNMWPGMILK